MLRTCTHVIENNAFFLFQAIQWARYQNDETMLINYEMIDRLLVEFFDDRQIEDFDVEHNRLRHSLVEIFGFNEIPKENIRQNKLDGICQDFFVELEECGKWLTVGLVEIKGSVDDMIKRFWLISYKLYIITYKV